MTTLNERSAAAAKAAGMDDAYQEHYQTGYADGYEAGLERGRLCAEVASREAMAALLQLASRLAPHIDITATVETKARAARPGKKGAGKG